MKKIILTISSLVMLQAFAQTAYAEHAKEPKQMKWAFEGVFGTFDRQQIQRGFQVYKEVCHTCHSLKHLSYRNLEEIGFTPQEVKAFAAEFKVATTDDNGNPAERLALPSDSFVAPFANEKAARMANGGAMPPDQSLLIKAREDGANYMYSLLTGYEKTPEGLEAPTGKFYNAYFPGHFISMPQPLQDGMVTYQDGTEATEDQMARDVVSFLQWAAEPEMEKRKRMGAKALMYLTLFTALFYVAKCRIWSRLDK